MAAVMAANILNFVYNALLGRTVSIEEFGVIILITNFLYIFNIFLNALAATVNQEVAHDDLHHEGMPFIQQVSKHILRIGGVLSILWILATPAISAYFHIGTNLTLVLFSPLFLIYPFAAIGRGYYQGRFAFLKSGALVLFEPVIKLAALGLILLAGWHASAYISLYFSAFITGIAALMALMQRNPATTALPRLFPKIFYINAVIASCSTIAFLALDVVIVKHFMTPTAAGQYALLSLIGKTIYFLGTLLNMFTISLVSREAGKPRRKFVPFYYLLFGAVFLTGIGYLIFGTFGPYFAPLLFGDKALSILPYTHMYILSMICYTVGSILVTYHLAKKEYSFPIVGALSSALLLIGIMFYHTQISDVVRVFFYASIVYVSVLFALHLKHNFFTQKIAVDYIPSS